MESITNKVEGSILPDTKKVGSSNKNIERNHRILIIDDNEAIHNDFRAILESKDENAIDLGEEKNAIFGNQQIKEKLSNFEITSAFQGKEGLLKIQQALQEGHPYAMAFIDMRMPPGWDGLETIQKIWEEYPDLQVVICTAYSDYSWHEIVKKLGETEKLLILKKPFDNIEVYQLASALTEKWYLTQKARSKQEELEQIVKQRTELLEETNRQLTIALEEAEEADRAKSEFLANMSHEIRTPMSSVIGFSDVLAEEDLTENQKKYVELIRQSGKNLMQIINDILDFSKIKAGKFEIKMIECDLDQILSEVESIMGLDARNKGLEFKIIQKEKLPSQIYTDPTRLRQCFINLIGNSLKFTEKGHIYLIASLEYDNDNKPYIRFDVEDTGIGIKSENLESIFESFSQVDHGASRKYGGTGLGLAITKQLSNLLGGTISLTSQLGKGSVFTLTIPVGMDIKPKSSSAKYDTSKNSTINSDNQNNTKLSGSVLIAEDCPSNQLLVKIILQKMGVDVTIANDGLEAVRKAQSQSFDLILMDMQMPEMNGYEATKILREKNITTPIIACTASATEGACKKCLDVGCTDYISKPIKRDELYKTISKYLPLIVSSV